MVQLQSLRVSVGSSGQESSLKQPNLSNNYFNQWGVLGERVEEPIIQTLNPRP